MSCWSARALVEAPTFGDVDRAEVLYRIGCCRTKLSQVANAVELFTLALSQNSSQTGYGGVCYGDSGGPTFPGTTIVALTSNGNKSCTGNAYQYRLDTPSARGVLSQFVALP